MSKPLFIQHRAPYQGYGALETLDALLVAAAFGQNPSVLFQGDGVWQLLPLQEAQLMGRASVVAQLEALPLYDVDDIYVDEASLIARGLDVAQLALPVTRVKQQEMAAFIAQHSPLIRF